MEHRHLFHKSPMFETDHDQNRNNSQSSMHWGVPGVANGGSLCVENMLHGGVNISSNWVPAVRSSEYVPSSISMEATQPQVLMAGPSYYPFQHPSVARNFLPTNQSFADRPSSSNHHYCASSSSSTSYGHLVHGHEDSNTSSGNGRGPHKRKRTAAHSLGTSSDFSISSLDKPNSGSQLWPWEVVSVTPSDRGSSLSIAGEASQRNVRNRSTLDLDVNQARAHALRHPPHYIHSMGMGGLANQTVGANTREWNHIPIPSGDFGRMVTGSTSSSHDTNQFYPGNSVTAGSLEIDGYRTNHMSNRNPVIPPQNIHFPSTPVARGGRSNYVQRAIPSHRIIRSYQRPGYVASSSERVMQSVPESYSSTYSRPPSMIGWRSSDRSGRLRAPYQRSIPLTGAVDARDRLGFMMMEHTALYDSRNLLDQHSDMRLDVDNMSYEELIALEERIGNVSTGLSEDTMWKCLRERTHYSPPNQIQEENSCVICLDEYKSKDVIATLANCGHEYHSNCIRTWLSMKKVCPICKAPAVEDCFFL